MSYKKKNKRLKDKISKSKEIDINLLIRALKKQCATDNTLPLWEIVNRFCKQHKLNDRCQGKHSALSLLRDLYYRKILLLKPKTHDTPIEKLYEDILIKHHIGYEKQFPIGSYRVDFYIPSFNLVVECDGFEHHRTKESMASDYIRQNYIVCQGYKVLRYSWRMIKEDRCIADLSKL